MTVGVVQRHSSTFGVAVHISADHLSRDLRDDGVAVGAQASHAAGNPISQQGNAGFNPTPFGIVAGDACGGTPEVTATGAGHSRACRAIQNTCRGSRSSLLAPSFRGANDMPKLSLWSRVVGVGQNPEAVSPVGGVDGTSRDNDRPAGVVDAFQVIQHSVEPCLANRCRNLLSHERSGPAGTDEPEKVGPQVPIVILAFAIAGDGERLAGRASRPDLSIVRPPSKSSCEGPSADSGEEVALPVSGEVGRLNIGNAPGVDVAGGD